ncbi:MAG: septal ring lytic transglycosylase RlpA family protein [Alphaproteobacteria bacterium]|nr:septal ring lytic transglycosylase RlpA family protein [Alphaproteobacteria bacterium]
MRLSGGHGVMRGAGLRPSLVGLLLALAACSTTPDAPTQDSSTAESVARPDIVNGADRSGFLDGIDEPYAVAAVPSVTPSEPGYSAVGVASWYGRRFHGRRTANGERYDMYAMTAAHQTLPFGALVRVTNLENGRSVVLRINDRGPFKDGRIIDVSRSGAAQLNFVRAGLARVRVDVILDGQPTASRLPQAGLPKPKPAAPRS